MGINRGKALTELPELTVDVGDAGLIYVDSSNRVGIGVSDPAAELEVMATTTQLMLSYDSDSFTTVTVADASHTTIATGESGNLIFDAAGDIELNADGADIVFKDGSATIGKFSSTSVLGMTLGAGVAEDIMIAFDGNAQDFRIGIDDGTDTLEIGHGTAHGTNTALTIDSSGQVTKFNIPAAAVAQASDHIIFLDGGATGAPKAESIDDFLTAIAGSGISVSSSQLTASGGGSSALNDLSDASFSSGDLTITALDTLTTSASAHDTAGTAVKIQAGTTTAGTTNNIAGGALTLAGGQGKGSGAGGDIIFQTANAGSSGSSLNSLATALTISDDLSSTFAGGITSTGGVNTLGATEITQGAAGGAILFTLDNDDTDKIAFKIEAANIDESIINIDADALTTAHVMEVSADALTAGSILKLVSDSSSTTARSLIDITNDNAAATGATPLMIRNDAAGGGGILVESTAAETKPLLDLINSSSNADKPSILAFTKINGAADDYGIGNIVFAGENDAVTPEPIDYIKILATASDVSDGTEDGRLRIQGMSAGSNTTFLDCKGKGKSVAVNGSANDSRGSFQILRSWGIQMYGHDNSGGGADTLDLTGDYSGHGFIYVIDTSGDSVTVNLPAASSAAGRMYMFIKNHASNNLNVDGNSTEVIYGVGIADQTRVSATDKANLWIICDGGGWHIITTAGTWS